MVGDELKESQNSYGMNVYDLMNYHGLSTSAKLVEQVVGALQREIRKLKKDNQLDYSPDQIVVGGESAGGGSGFRSLLWGMAALAMTLTLKPTAIAFSGLLFLSSAAFLLAHR